MKNKNKFTNVNTIESNTGTIGPLAWLLNLLCNSVMCKICVLLSTMFMTKNNMLIKLNDSKS